MPRRLLHTRSIELQGFVRDDGLFELEARLTDRKSYDSRRFPDATLPAGWATLWSMQEGGTASGTVKPTGTWDQLISMKPPSSNILDGSSGLPDQLSLVNGYADLRTDRAREILAQMSPQYAL